jgi:hypothetical protein
MFTRIVIPGRAVVSDGRGTTITAAPVLTKLHRTVDDAALPIADALDPPLCDIGVVGGSLELRYERARGLRVLSVFRAPRQLSKSEAQLLVELAGGATVHPRTTRRCNAPRAPASLRSHALNQGSCLPSLRATVQTTTTVSDAEHRQSPSLDVSGPRLGVLSDRALETRRGRRVLG